MRYLLLIYSLFIVFSSFKLVAQSETLCSTNPIQNAFVELRAADAWRTCDMRCSGQPEPHHILLVGDSVGALLAASPEPNATIGGGVKSKSWDYFLKNPAPQGMTNWRVLNTAISGNAAGFFVNSVQNCLGDPNSKEAKLFRDTAPGRVWMEIGGNDIKYAKIISVNPHWAHYVNNSVLNNLGKMVALFQKNGRTVLLMGYHSRKAEVVAKGSLKNLNPQLLERLCGSVAGLVENAEDELQSITGIPNVTQAIGVDFLTGSCILQNGINQLITGAASEVFDNLNKFRLWLQNQLGPLGEILNGQFLSKIPGMSTIYSGLRQIDLGFGRALGMEQSLTGLFENPAERFRGRNGNEMENYLDLLKGGQIPWKQFWDFLQTVPRYEEGWAVQFSDANKERALSAVITIYGRRLKESYWSQGVPIPGTNRRTVEYVTAEAEMKDPFIEWGSRNELMADDVHPNDAGYSVYAPVIARKLKSLQYDTVPNDYDFAKQTWRDWTPLVENPYLEDLAWLLLCFYTGHCIR